MFVLVINFVVVLYSKGPLNSETLTSLLKIKFESLDIKPFFYIRDNSESGFDFSLFNERCNFDYIVSHDGYNKSLSEVYNKALDFFDEDKKCEKIIFLDDDSYLDECYFHEVKNLKKLVSVPIIKFKGEVISPGKIFGVKGCKIYSYDDFVNEKIKLVAMMSGTIVDFNVFNSYGIRFNERLSLYGVDTRFFIDCYEKGITLNVIDYVMNHDSALRKKYYDKNNMVSRLDNLMQSQIIVFNNVPCYRLQLTIYFFIFILKKVTVERDVIFLKLFRNFKYLWTYYNE